MPKVIEALVKGLWEGNQFQTLLGVTGSGKTFTMANVIATLNKPTLVIAHNKTLAGQLYGEFNEFFPENAVEYLVLFSFVYARYCGLYEAHGGKKLGGIIGIVNKIRRGKY